MTNDSAWPKFVWDRCRSAVSFILTESANVTTTMNIYVKTVSVDAANAMKNLEAICATTVQPNRLGRTRIV